MRGRPATNPVPHVKGCPRIDRFRPTPRPGQPFSTLSFDFTHYCKEPREQSLVIAHKAPVSRLPGMNLFRPVRIAFLKNSNRVVSGSTGGLSSMMRSPGELEHRKRRGKTGNPLQHDTTVLNLYGSDRGKDDVIECVWNKGYISISRYMSR